MLPLGSMSDEHHRSSSLNRVASSQLGFKTPWPRTSLSWSIVAGKGTYSAPHHDAGKFSTWIRVVTGYKLWAIAERDASIISLVDVDVSNLKWHYYVLGPGCKLYVHWYSSQFYVQLMFFSTASVLTTKQIHGTWCHPPGHWTGRMYHGRGSPI